ncbi:hypothetical protein ACQ4M3_05495 [Leptolyngbya sp. AN03gr2]|uniref:hypothetical protein n=1 Tax=unclassified Leptolyngbya TaxID=2650499 RepID=UPI003D317F2F
MTDAASISPDPSLTTTVQPTATLSPTQTAEATPLTAEQQTLLTEILQRIRQQAILSGYADPYVPIVVRHGNRRLFEAIVGEAPRCNRIQPEHLELLQAALERPETVQGTFKIFIGKEEVYRVQDGVVKTDLLGLAARSHLSSDSEIQAPQNTATSTLEVPTAEQAASSIEQKSQTNGHFSEVQSTKTPEATELPQQASVKSSTNSSVPETQGAVPPPTPVNANSLQPDLERLQTQIQQLEQRIQQLTQQLQSVQSSPTRWLAQTEQNIQSWARSFGQTVKQAIAEPMIRSMEAGLRQVIKMVGDSQADGSIAYDSKRDQRYVIDGNRIAVSGRETGQNSSPTQTAVMTQTPAQLWNQYTQNLQGTPTQIAVQAARQALQDHIPASAVRQMMHLDPQFQKIQAQQGSQFAQRYAELVVGRANSQALQHLQTRENLRVSHPVRSTTQQV